MRTLGRLLSTVGMLALCFVIFGLFALLWPNQAKTGGYPAIWPMIGLCVSGLCFWGATKIGPRD